MNETERPLGSTEMSVDQSPSWRWSLLEKFWAITTVAGICAGTFAIAPLYFPGSDLLNYFEVKPSNLEVGIKIFGATLALSATTGLVYGVAKLSRWAIAETLSKILTIAAYLKPEDPDILLPQK